MASSLTTSTARECAPGTVQLARKSRARGYRPLAVVAALLLMAVFAAGCDWLQPRFDGGSSNFNPYEPALTAATVGSLTKRFSVQGGGPIVVDGQLAYVTSNAAGNTIVATVNANTGAPGWTTTLPGAPGQLSGLVSDGTNIYVVDQEVDNTITSGCLSGDTVAAVSVVAISAATGAITLNVPLESDTLCLADMQLALAGGHLYVLEGRAVSGTGIEYTLTALDSGTGAALWSYNAGPVSDCCGPATISTTGAFVAFTWNSNTVIFNAADGSVRSSNVSASPPAGQYGPRASLTAGRSGSFFGLVGGPICDAGCLPNPTTHLAAVDANTGAVEWNTPEGANLPQQPQLTITDSRLIVVAANPSTGGGFELEALDIKTGLVEWQTDLPAGTTLYRLIVAGNLVYVVTADGTTATLRTYDIATGDPVSSMALPSSSYGPATGFLPEPIVAEGHVYVESATSIDAYAPAS